jgi:Co/Zn/Cd efflux system component
MAHNHAHDHGHHGHGMHDHRDSPENYKKAGWIGIQGFFAEGLAGYLIAGSLGAVGDALHALTDALSFFLSARYVRLEKEGRSAIDYDKRSVLMQTAFLLCAIVLLAVNAYIGNRFIELSSWGMLLAGSVGLYFNKRQMNRLGASLGRGMNRHEAARQHAFLDVLFSCVVIHGALLTFLIEWNFMPLLKAGLAFWMAIGWAVYFVRSGFIDLGVAPTWKRALYIFMSIVGAIASPWLVLKGSTLYVDYAVGLFLGVAMLASLSINAIALAFWDKGGRSWAHIH